MHVTSQLTDQNSPTSGAPTVTSATDMTLTNTGTTIDADMSASSGSVSGAIVAGCLVFVAIVIVVIIVAVSLVMCWRQRRKSKPMVLLPFTNNEGYARVLYPQEPMGDERIPVTSYRAYSNVSETNVDMLRYANEGLFKESDNKEYEKDDVAFWEPADTVNELYKQLSSKKYKEISRNDLEYEIYAHYYYQWHEH